MLSDSSMGLFNPVFSGPSMFEVGEGSLAGEGGSAQASLMIEHKFGVSARCTMPLLEADAFFFVGSNSDEPSMPSGEADDSPCADTSSDELAMTSSEVDDSSFASTSSDELKLSPGKADGPFYTGTSCDELAAPLDKADDLFSTGISSVELSLLPSKFDDPFSVDTSSNELILSLGKSDMVSSRPSIECFLSDLFLSLSRAGLVVLGDNEGDEGGLDSLMPTAALEFEQPSLAELPTKALCAIPGVSALVEEEFNFSDTGLGGEDSSPIPLLSITPFGLPLTAELNCGNEAVGYERILDTSRWVKNRLPSFSKLVGLPLNRHEKLCIVLLQRIEKETEATKAMNKKVTPSRKVVIFKDKGKRELRNLQSSVNYNGR